MTLNTSPGRAGPISAECLESRLLLSAVAGRHVFYNDSVFDGRDPAAGAGDDAAVAPDKSALLPGQSASYANLTTFTRGLNGVMVDLTGLPAGAALTAADFTFDVGSGNGRDWAVAPVPLDVATRPGAGAGGSDRVTITWPNAAIRNVWLRVTVAANAPTGLAFPDVFYFGHLAGDTGAGNTATRARVNSIDVAYARRSLNSAAPLTARSDFNRDGRVNALDLGALRQNYSRSLRLIRVPEYAPAFSTYLGGSRGEQIRDITTDAAGNVYVTGGGDSANFPTTPGAFDRTHNGSYDVFVAKYAPDGRLLWSTLVGGPAYDRAYAIEVDAQGHVYIAGRAGPGFPTTAGAFQPTYSGFYSGTAYKDQNAFVAKLRPDGSGLMWASYFGSYELIRDLDVDADGDVYVAGSRKPIETSTPPAAWFAGRYQPAPAGGWDTVLAKLDGDGTRVQWATYFGGSLNDGAAPSVRVDASEHVFLASTTQSTNLPTTPNAFDRTYNGGGDMFLARFTPDGTGLLFSTYVGGSGNEAGETHNLALDRAGNAYLAGYTNSGDLPTTPGALQRTFGGGANDAYVYRFTPGGALLAATYFGGAGGEGVQGITTDLFGNPYLSGGTTSDNLPVTPGAFQARRAGASDYFVARLRGDLSAVQYVTYLGGPGADDARASYADPAGNFYVAGHAEAAFPLLNAHQPTYGGQTDSALAKFILLS